MDAAVELSSAVANGRMPFGGSGGGDRLLTAVPLARSRLDSPAANSRSIGDGA